MYSVGVMQEFPRAEKRRLLGARGQHEAGVADQKLNASRLEVRRDAGLAWLEVWQPERAAELARASVRESELQLQATQIAYTAGTASQADVLAARGRGAGRGGTRRPISKTWPTDRSIRSSEPHYRPHSAKLATWSAGRFGFHARRTIPRLCGEQMYFSTMHGVNDTGTERSDLLNASFPSSRRP